MRCFRRSRPITLLLSLFVAAGLVWPDLVHSGAHMRDARAFPTAHPPAAAAHRHLGDPAAGADYHTGIAHGGDADGAALGAKPETSAHPHVDLSATPSPKPSLWVHLVVRETIRLLEALAPNTRIALTAVDAVPQSGVPPGLPPPSRAPPLV